MKNGGVLLVWDRMGDYHRARWEAVKKQFPAHPVYAADLGGSDQLYHWNSTSGDPHYVRLSDKPPGTFDARRIGRFVRFLSSGKITCICIAGYGRPEYLFFLIWGRITGRRVVLFAESWYPSSKVVDKLKSILIRLTCHGVLASGKRAAAHFIDRLGIPAGRVKTGYSVVDNDHFAAPRVSRNRQLLCIARFAPEKNLVNLIRSFLASRLAVGGWTLRVVGGGPLERELKELAKDQRVEIYPWQSYDQLPSLYASASAFVLPSTFEPWGLVVNEAMAARLPVLVSNEAGCAPDLVDPGKNGWVFSPHPESDLRAVMNRLAETGTTQLDEMGEHSAAIIRSYTVDLFASNLKALILADDAG